ncbi:MAG: ATP-dependent helicase RecG, partial [Chloroflexota bacterium]|nr:ATP-dependent helicase RecG [Chloroflexota bacterium]
MALGLSSPVIEIPKVGPTDASRLAKLGIETVRDLLLHLPFGWDEYGEPTAVAQLTDGKQATVIGTIESISAKRSKYKKMQLTEASLKDDSGGILKLVWFNQAWMANQLHKGDRVAVAGMVRGRYGVWEMRNPLHEKVSAAGPRRLRDLMPRYHLVKGLSSKRIAEWIEAVLPLANDMEDILPIDALERHHLLPIAEAVRAGHHPDSALEWQMARRRMAFAE